MYRIPAGPRPKARLTRRSVLGMTLLGLAPVLAGCTAPFTSGDERGVFVVDLEGPELRRVASGSPWVAWSTDSQQLALRDADGTIRVASADGAGSQPFAGGTFHGPGWSPSGTEIAVIDPKANTIRIETGGGVVVGQAPLREDVPPLWTIATPTEDIPIWSPDGTAIAFLAWDGTGDALYTINPAGAERKKLTDIRVSQNRVDRYDWLGQRVAEGDVGAPAWAPNSQFLAYAVYPEVRGAVGGIYIVAARGGWPSLVTDQTPTGGPAWSPDGRQIAFTARSGNRGTVFVGSTNGSDTRNLTEALNVSARDPAWSPDGLQLAFVAEGDLCAVRRPQRFVNDQTSTRNSLAGSVRGDHEKIALGNERKL